MSDRTEPVELVHLKNGSQESRTKVDAFMNTLRGLFTEDPTAAYDLVLKARNPQHHIFQAASVKLKTLNLLLPDGDLHQTVRNIIISGVTGEGLRMVLANPIDQRTVTTEAG